MFERHRLVAALACWLGLTGLCHEGWAQTDVTGGGPALVCVRRDSSVEEGIAVRRISAGERCRGSETRMRVVASPSLPFTVDTTSGTPTEAAAEFVATIVPTLATAPTSAPALIRSTLVVDVDRGLFEITSRGPIERGDPAAIHCATFVDGERLGNATSLASSGPIPIPAGPQVDLDGRRDFPSPGYVPDAHWSRLDDDRALAAGRHRFVIACRGNAAFRFGGVGSLLVLQDAPSNTDR